MIERCTIDDVPELMPDLRNLHAEMAPFGDFNEEKSEALLRDTIKNHIVMQANDFAGHMALRVESHWYTQDLAIYEYYIYVKKNNRKSRTAFDLYKAAKTVAKQNKMPFFYGTFRSPDSGFARVHKFLQRQGGIQIGSQFFYKG